VNRVLFVRIDSGWDSLSAVLAFSIGYLKASNFKMFILYIVGHYMSTALRFDWSEGVSLMTGKSESSLIRINIDSSAFTRKYSEWRKMAESLDGWRIGLPGDERTLYDWIAEQGNQRESQRCAWIATLERLCDSDRPGVRDRRELEDMRYTLLYMMPIPVSGGWEGTKDWVEGLMYKPGKDVEMKSATRKICLQLIRVGDERPESQQQMTLALLASLRQELPESGTSLNPRNAMFAEYATCTPDKWTKIVRFKAGDVHHFDSPWWRSPSLVKSWRPMYGHHRDGVLAKLRRHLLWWGQDSELLDCVDVRSLDCAANTTKPELVDYYLAGHPEYRHIKFEIWTEGVPSTRSKSDSHHVDKRPISEDLWGWADENEQAKSPRGPAGPESWYSSNLDDATPVIWQALYGGGEYETFGANDLLTVVEAGLDMLDLGIEIEIPELIVRGKGSGEMAFRVESIRESVRRMVKDASFTTRSGSFATAKAARRLSELPMEAGDYLDNRAVLELAGHGDLEGRVVSYRVDVSRRQMLVIAKLAGWKGDRGSGEGLHLTRRMWGRYKERVRRDSAIAEISRRVGWRMAIEEVDEMGTKAAVILYRIKKGDLGFYRERNSTFSKLALRTESSYIQRTAHWKGILIDAEDYVRDREGRTLREYLYDEDDNDLNRSIEEMDGWEEDNVWLPYGQYTEMGYPLHLPFGNLIRQMEHDSRPHNLPDSSKAKRFKGLQRRTSAYRNPDTCPRCPLEKCTCGYERRVVETVSLSGTFIAHIDMTYSSYSWSPRWKEIEIRCHCKSKKGRICSGYHPADTWRFNRNWWCPNCFDLPTLDSKQQLYSRLQELEEGDEAEFIEDQSDLETV
jgi:hypothetical protein